MENRQEIINRLDGYSLDSSIDELISMDNRPSPEQLNELIGELRDSSSVWEDEFWCCHEEFVKEYKKRLDN